VIRRRIVSRAPLGIAAVLAVPVFFVSLMAFSLAVERASVTHEGGVVVYHIEHGWQEWRIWALALVPALIVLLAGGIASFIRRGVYGSALAAVLTLIVVDHPLDRWAARHTRRFPLGEDLFPDKQVGNILNRAEWEQSARHTALSMSHWVFGLAAAIALVPALLELRRRLVPDAPPVAPPPEIASAPPGATRP
jgi:hypothetical protein